MAKKNTAFFEDEEFMSVVEEAMDRDDATVEIPDDEYEPERPQLREELREGRPMIIRELNPDKYTKVRKRIPLTRSMCIVQGCSFDAAKAMGQNPDKTPIYAEWKRVPPARRQECLELLETHKIMAHSASNQHIVFESDMETEWLGATA